MYHKTLSSLSAEDYWIDNPAAEVQVPASYHLGYGGPLPALEAAIRTLHAKASCKLAVALHHCALGWMAYGEQFLALSLAITTHLHNRQAAAAGRGCHFSQPVSLCYSADICLSSAAAALHVILQCGIASN